MKRVLLSLIIVCVVCLSAEAQIIELERLVYTKQFTLLNQKLKDPVYNNIKELNVIKAIMLSAFGKPAESNKFIEKAKRENISLPDSLMFYIFQAEVNNYIALNDYKNALAKGTYLLGRFPSFFTKEQTEDEQEALKIWKKLIDVKPQELHKQGDTHLPLKKDMAGLWNIPVMVNDSSRNFIFDSGAGLSTITASFAQLLGLTILENSDIEVKSGITGISNKSKLGIANELHIGNMRVNNVVFLVFPDSALSFANGAYKINGIIGYPVIREMESFTITKKEIFIPLHDSARNLEKNMTIDQLKPVIYLSYNNEVLPFTFDTGARTSIFSDNFYNRYKDLLDKEGMSKETSFGGAGGNKKFKIVEMPELNLMHYDKNISLKNAQVSKEHLDANETYYYGNLGQDLMKKFDKLTINFNESYILFQ